MRSEDIYTVGDLIQWLQQQDPIKRIYIHDSEWDQDNPLQSIEVKSDCIVFYDY